MAYISNLSYILLVLLTLVQTSLASDRCYGYCWYYNWYLWFGVGWFVIISLGVCLGFYRRYRLRRMQQIQSNGAGRVTAIAMVRNGGVGVNVNPNHQPMGAVEPQKPPSYDASQFQPYPVAPPPYPGPGTYPNAPPAYPPASSYPPNSYPPINDTNYPSVQQQNMQPPLNDPAYPPRT